MKAFCAPVGPDPNALRGVHSNQFTQDIFIIEPSRFTKDTFFLIVIAVLGCMLLCVGLYVCVNILKMEK